MQRQSDASHRWFLVAVFVAIAVVTSTSFIIYSLQPPRPAPTDNLVFASASLVQGNASFVIQNVSHGPYAFSGFLVRLVVNDFPSGPVALGPSGSVHPECDRDHDLSNLVSRRGRRRIGERGRFVSRHGGPWTAAFADRLRV